MVDLAKDPKSFEDAFNHPEIDKKIKWCHTISKEFEEMKSKGVWEKSEIPMDETVSRISGFLKRAKQNETEFFEHS